MHTTFAIVSTTLAAAMTAQTTTMVTLTVSNMVFRQDQLASPSATLYSYLYSELRAVGPVSTNHLWGTWWWYRVAGDTLETGFLNDPAPNAPTRIVSPPRLVTTWPNVAGRNLFSAVLTQTLVSTSATTGYLADQMVITNISGAPLTIDLFRWADIDCNNRNIGNNCFGDDRSQYMERADNLTATCEYYCPDADAAQVTVWSSATPGTLPHMLLNATVDNLTGWSGSMLNNDWNGAFQWSRTLPPSGSATFTSFLAVITSRPLESLYGTAGAGTPGLPTIAGSARAITVPTAVVPRSFDVVLGNALPGALSVLVTNFTQAALTINGLQVFVEPAGAATSFGLTNASGGDSRTFQVPGSATLAGLQLNHQYFVLDSGGVGGFASYTQGLAQTLGSW